MAGERQAARTKAEAVAAWNRRPDLADALAQAGDAEAGARLAVEQPLFLEQYLDAPVEQIIARLAEREGRGVVIGMTLVGPAVAELLHAATIAVVGEVPIDRLWHAVPAYPTISEVWLRLLEAYRDR